MVTTAIGVMKPDDCAAIHVNMPLAFPEPDQRQDIDPFEQAAVATLTNWEEKGSGYFKQQSTRPQTLGYGPTWARRSARRRGSMEEDVGLDRQSGNPEDALTLDEMLDNIMLYWLPATATSSGRLYWESFRHRRRRIPARLGFRRRQRLSARDPPPLSALGRSWMRADPTTASWTGGATSPPGSSRRCTPRNPRLLRQGTLSTAAPGADPRKLFA